MGSRIRPHVQPGGPDTSVQFNDSGRFNGNAELLWDKINKILTLYGDLRTDRWDNSDTNTFLGMLVGGDGTLSGATHNTGVGYKVFESIVGGVSNTAFGSRALRELLNGTYNTCIGDLSGLDITGGDYNSGVGASSLENLTTGNYNTALGYRAARSITTANGQVAIGAQAMQNVATGINNIAIGYQAILSATNFGQKNIGIGWGAMASAGNTNYTVGIGSQTLPVVTGDNNVGIGREVLSNLISGANNVGIGYQAGYNNVSGVRNVFIGFQAGYSETGSHKLYMHNSNSAIPLIYGEFDNRILKIHGNLYLPADTYKMFFGAGNDVEMYYDGSKYVFNTNLQNPSDLELNCGTDKTLKLIETVWEDLRVPVTAIKLFGARDPDFIQFKDNGSGSIGVFTYHFSKINEEELHFIVQMPHSWKEGTDIFPHVHWSPIDTDTGDVTWGLEYAWVNKFETSGDTTIITVTDPADGIADKHQRVDFDAIDGDGKELSSILVCRVFRDVDNNDDYDNDAALFEIDFHYEVNTMGSRRMYTK